MPTTHRPRTSDLFPHLSSRGTNTKNAVDYKVVPTRISLTGTDEISLLYAEGDIELVKVVFVPDTALTADPSNAFTIALQNTGTDGTGTTAVGSTYDTGTDALVKHDAASIYAPNEFAGAQLADGEVLRAVCTETGTATLEGTFYVYYVNLIP